MSGYLNFYANHPALAALAEAINDAGHAYHNTLEWQEQDWMLNDGPHAGKTRCEVIQAAFDAADAAFCSEGPARGGEIRRCPECAFAIGHAETCQTWRDMIRNPPLRERGSK